MRCRSYTHTVYIDGRPQVCPRYRLPQPRRDPDAGSPGSCPASFARILTPS